MEEAASSLAEAHRAFAVLDEELEAHYEHMQVFHDQRVAPMETI